MAKSKMPSHCKCGACEECSSEECSSEECSSEECSSEECSSEVDQCYETDSGSEDCCESTGTRDQCCEVGPPGPRGRRGHRGHRGPQGDQGSRGFRGYQGVQGPTGPQGKQGIQGPQGPQGVSGTTGPTGSQGEKGATGSTGTAGTKVVTDCVTISGGVYGPTTPVPPRTYQGEFIFILDGISEGNGTIYQWFEQALSYGIISYFPGNFFATYIDEPSVAGILQYGLYEMTNAGGLTLMVPYTANTFNTGDLLISACSNLIYTFSEYVNGTPIFDYPPVSFGITGPTGDTGSKGEQGAVGPTGATGSAGSPGTQIVNECIQYSGPFYRQGATVPPGVTGDYFFQDYASFITDTGFLYVYTSATTFKIVDVPSSPPYSNFFVTDAPNLPGSTGATKTQFGLYQIFNDTDTSPGPVLIGFVFTPALNPGDLVISPCTNLLYTFSDYVHEFLGPTPVFNGLPSQIGFVGATGATGPTGSPGPTGPPSGAILTFTTGNSAAISDGYIGLGYQFPTPAFGVPLNTSQFFPYSGIVDNFTIKSYDPTTGIPKLVSADGGIIITFQITVSGTINNYSATLGKGQSTITGSIPPIQVSQGDSIAVSTSEFTDTVGLVISVGFSRTS